MARRRRLRRISPAIEHLESRRLLATIVVTTLADSGEGSLREAITLANAMPDHDTIVFAPGVTGTINLASRLPQLWHRLDIIGPGPDLLTIRRDTGGDYPVLHTGHNFFTIQGLTISNGKLGINNEWGDLTVINCVISDNDGPGILCAQLVALKLIDSTVSGNTGRGIFGFFAFITVNNSTISGNMDGGITNSAGGTFNSRITVSNSTISGNSTNGSGGGILNSSGTVARAKLIISSSTITNNRADADGDGVGTGGGVFVTLPSDDTITNSIIAGNYVGTGSTASDAVSISPGSANLIGGDPMLAPLADNGGPTLTHALLRLSPAIDAGSTANVPPDMTTDQRGEGFARIVGDAVDIGAVEVQNTTVRHRAFLVDTLPHRLEFRFNMDVSASLDLGDITVEHLPTQTIVNPTSLSYDTQTNTATFAFDGMLDEGTYRAVIEAAGVVGANGLPMYADEVYDFFFLLGDANQDGLVNLQDFNRLAANFGQSPRTFTQGDFNYDGVVNLADFNLLAERFGMILPPPTAVASALRGASFGYTDRSERADEPVSELLG